MTAVQDGYDGQMNIVLRGFELITADNMRYIRGKALFSRHEVTSDLLERRLIRRILKGRHREPHKTLRPFLQGNDRPGGYAAGEFIDLRIRQEPQVPSAPECPRLYISMMPLVLGEALRSLHDHRVLPKPGASPRGKPYRFS